MLEPEVNIPDCDKDPINREEDPLAWSSLSPSDSDSDEWWNPGFSDNSDSCSDHAQCSDVEDEGPRVKRPRICDALSPPKSAKCYEWVETGSAPKSSQLVSPDDEEIMDVEDMCLEPWGIFSRFFTDSFIQLVVKLTNQNGVKFGKALRVTDEELQAFIGMLIIMGFHRLPSYREYWSSNANFSVKRISDLMSLPRFRTLMKFISFHDVTLKKKCEEIDKVRPLLDHLNEKFLDGGFRSNCLSIDQPTVWSKGSYKSLLTVICCSKSSYLHKVHVRSQGDCSTMDDVVRDLVSSFEGKGVIVSFPRCFTTFPLVEELYDKRIFVCAEMSQHDPNIPSFLKNQHLARDLSNFVQSGDFSITRYKTWRNLLVLSTVHDPSEQKSMVEQEVKDYPKPIADFRLFRRSVKKFYRLQSNHGTAWSTRQWSMKIFYFLLDSAIVNSYLIYKSSWPSVTHEINEKPLSMVQFRSSLADRLIHDFVSNRKRPTCRNRTPETETMPCQALVDSNGASHMPTSCTRRRCAYCSTRKVQKRTVIACTKCKVALCLLCFAPYHAAMTENDFTFDG